MKEKTHSLINLFTYSPKNKPSRGTNEVRVDTETLVRRHSVGGGAVPFIARRSVAFTLAEVLITLAIIGVVAAMTIPTLISKYQERVTVTKVKKFYSDFSQAYQMAVMENGPLYSWGLSNSSTETNEETGSLYQKDSSFENYNAFFEKMKPYLRNIKYKKMSTDKTTGDIDGGWYMPDGTAIVTMWLAVENESCKEQNGYCGDFYIHTEGKSFVEASSKYDKKVFCFKLYNDHIVPFGDNKHTFDNECKNGSNLTRCTGWVIMKGNMDYLHCPDELDWNTKTKCD